MIIPINERRATLVEALLRLRPMRIVDISEIAGIPLPIVEEIMDDLQNDGIIVRSMVLRDLCHHFIPCAASVQPYVDHS